jgi:high-affinity nickel permease
VFFIVLMLACHFHSTDRLYLSSNSLTGKIPSQIALMSNLGESSVVWLLVVMIVLSCVFFIALSCLLVIFHSTAYLWLSSNSLTGTIPSKVGLMSNLGESSVVWLLVVMIVLPCVCHCTLMLVCHFSFYRWVGSLLQ